MIESVGQVMLYVNDQKAAAEFWTQKVGFTKSTEVDNGDGTFSIEIAPKETSDTSFVLHDRKLVEKLRGDDRRAAIAGHHSHRFGAISFRAGDFFCGHGRVQRCQGQQGTEQGMMGFHSVDSFNRSVRAARARSKPPCWAA